MVTYARCNSVYRLLTKSQRREGFTLLELLVVMTIITLLVALILPAVQSARMAARRTQCLNNLRNIAIAIHVEAQSKRRLPAAGYFSATGPEMYHNWVVSLLPWLDRSDIHREWDFDLPSTDPVNQKLANLHLTVLVCPVDSTATGNGDLSYVVNGGFGWTAAGVRTIGGKVDLNGNGITNPADDGTPSDYDLLKLTGLFFVENWPLGSGTVRFHTMDSIADGLSQTIMLAENIHAGSDGTVDGNWASPLARRTTFVVTGRVCQDFRCAPGNVDYRRANDKSTGQAINASFTDGEGQAPWPTSYHPGGVNVAFADGRVKFLSEDIEGDVYANLVSPSGTLLQEPLTQGVVSDDEY